MLGLKKIKIKIILVLAIQTCNARPGGRQAN